MRADSTFQFWLDVLKLKYGSPKAGREAAARLGSSGRPRAARPLIRALRSGGAAVGASARQALVKLGGAAFAALLRELQSASAQRREAAAEALQGFGAAAAGPLARALRTSLSGYPEGRLGAVKVLGFIGNVDTVARLEAALTDPDVTVGVAAVRAIGAIARRAVYYLTWEEARGEPQDLWQGRIRAGGIIQRAMGRLAQPTLRALSAALKNPRGAVGTAAARELDGLYWLPSTSVLWAAYSVAKGDFESAVECGACAAGPLWHAMEDETRDRRAEAAKAFAKIQGRAGKTAVESALEEYRKGEPA